LWPFSLPDLPLPLRVSDPAFFGQLGAADVVYKGLRVGVVGVVHPEVLSNYGLKVVAGELVVSVSSCISSNGGK
jgi:phenylalanyl-tRNA synthetase beta subunit